MTDTRNFANYSSDLNGNGIVDGNGFNLPVDGEFPLQVGDTVKIYTRSLTYVGTDGAGGGIFRDPTDGGEVYGSDDVKLNDGDPFPDPVEEELPLSSGSGASDPVISIFGNAAAQDEGDEGTTDFTFDISRSGQGLEQESTVDVAFTAGDTNENDFGGTLPATQTVTFAAGETDKTVTIQVSGDQVFEPDETFTLSLENPTDATISDQKNAAKQTIVNDDEEVLPEAPVISIVAENANQNEGNSGNTRYTFDVVRSGNVSGTSSVEVAFSAGDTDAGDFGGTLPSTQTVNFSEHGSGKSIGIDVSGDIDFENNEAFTLSLQNPTDATIDETADTADGLIVNDDQELPNVPLISIAPADATPVEGDEGTTDYTFTVTRVGGDLSGASTVDVAFTAGDTDADDFGGTLPETQTVTFAADETEKTVVITGSGDTDVEPHEAFEVSLEFATNSIIDDTASSAEGTIFNDDVSTLNLINGTDGPDVLQGTEGNDVIRGFDDNDILLGNGGNDIIDGGDDEDVLAGGEGNDVLAGGNNSDSINGGAGNDILIGGDGEDVLRGDEDNDILTGGLRSDAFDFSGDFGNDVITDFDDNQDGIFFDADKEDITTEVFTNGTLITVESDITNGSVLLLGITDVDGLNI